MYKQSQRGGGVEHDRHIVVEDEASRHGAGQLRCLPARNGGQREPLNLSSLSTLYLTTLSSVFDYWQKLQLMAQDDLYLLLMALASSVVFMI